MMNKLFLICLAALTFAATPAPTPSRVTSVRPFEIRGAAAGGARGYQLALAEDLTRGRDGAGQYGKALTPEVQPYAEYLQVRVTALAPVFYLPGAANRSFCNDTCVVKLVRLPEADSVELRKTREMENALEAGDFTGAEKIARRNSSGGDTHWLLAAAVVGEIQARCRRQTKRIETVPVPSPVSWPAGWKLLAGLRQAGLAEERRDWPAAITAYQEAMKMPTFAALNPLVRGMIWERLALVYLAKERAVDAEEALRQSVAVSPSEPDAWRLMAATALRLDHPEAASEAVWKLQQLAPKSGETYFLKALLLTQARKWPAALAALDQAEAFLPAGDAGANDRAMYAACRTAWQQAQTGGR